MADDLARLGIEVRSEAVPRASDRLRGLETQGARTERSAGRLSTRFERLNDRTQRLRAAMFSLQGVLTGLGLAFGIRGVAGVIGQFQQSMAGVRAVTRGTADEMREMEQVARQLGATTRFSAAEAAEGMRFLGMAGFDTNQIIQAIPDTLNLAAAGALNLGRAADIASNVLSQFNMDAGQTNEVADTLALAAASANTSVEQLAEALEPVGGIAASVGVEMRTTVAALSALAEEGRQGSAAGTGLRRVLSGLLNPTAGAAGELEAMGLELEQLNPATNDLVGIIEQLADANLDAATAFQVFGDRGAPAVITLVNQLPQLREFVEAQRENAGIAEETAEIMNDNLVGAARALNSAWQELILQTGDRGLAGAMRTLVDAATGLLRVLAGMTDDLGENERLYRNLATAVEAVAAAMAAMVAVRVLSFLATMGREVVLLTRAMWGLNAAMIANPMGAFATAAGLTAAAFVALTADTRRSTEALNEHADALDQLVQRNEEMTESLQRQIRTYRRLSDEVSGLTIDQQIAALSRELANQQQELREYEEAWADILSGEVAGAVPENVLQRMRELEVQIAATREELLRLRDAAAESARASRTLERAIEAWGQFFPVIANDIEETGDEALTTSRSFEEMAARAQQVAEATELFDERQRDMLDTFRELQRELSPARDAIEDYRERMDFLNDVMSAFPDLAGEVMRAQEDLTQQFVQGGSAAEDTADSVTEIADSVREARRQAEREARLLAEPFEQAAEGIQRGFSDAFFDVFREARFGFEDLAGAIKDSFARMLAELATLAIARPIIVPAVQSAAGFMGLGNQAGLARQLGGAGSSGALPGFGGGMFDLGSLGSRLGFATPGRTVGAIPGVAPGVQMPATPGFLGTTATLPQVLAAGTLGALGGGFLTSLTGGNRTGGRVGGGLGATAGALIGSAIPGVGTLLGGLIGGGAGGLLGGLFGGGGPSNRRQSVELGAGGVTRRFGFTGAKFDEELRNAVDEIGEQVVGFIQGVQQITGEEFERSLRLDIGRRDPSRIFLDRQLVAQPGTTDAERLLQEALRVVAREFDSLADIVDRIDLSDVQQALQDIEFAVLVEEGRLFERQMTQTEQAMGQLRAGMEEFRQTARRLGLDVGEVERQAREAFERDLEDQLLAITDPLAAALREFERGAEARLDLARDLGADLALVEELNMRERQAIIERFGESTNRELESTLRDFLEGLAGPGSPLPAQARLAMAEGQFQEQVALARAGEGDPRALTRAGDTLLQAAEELFARSPEFFDRFRMVVDTFEELLGENVVPGFAGGTGSAPRGARVVGERGREVVHFRGGESVTSTDDISALLREIVRAISGSGGQTDATLTTTEQLAERLDVLIEEMQALRLVLSREPRSGRSQAELRRVGRQ